jgi:hypothetical protein
MNAQVSLMFDFAGAGTHSPLVVESLPPSGFGCGNARIYYQGCRSEGSTVIGERLEEPLQIIGAC